MEGEDAAPLSPDARAALAFGPVAKEFMDDLRGRLPPGTHFGIVILVSGQPEGRVLAVTTDREVVVPAVAQWVLSVLPEREQG